MKQAPWKQWFRSALDLCFNGRCPLCERSAPAEVCPDCLRQLQQCRWSGPQQWQGALPVLTWGHYEGALRRSIATLKYENQPQLARPLGKWLGQTWQTCPPATIPPRLTVVPIPMHPTKQKKRGFNQAELIAEAFCQQTGLPLKRQGLLRMRETEAQFKLSALARAENLSGAFAVGQELWQGRSAQSVLLVDDIYTTGATARSAAQALMQMGIIVCGIAVVARTPPPDSAKTASS